MNGLFDLAGRVAIVTGGSQGLGFAMANALAQYGASLVIASRDATKGSSAADAIEQACKTKAIFVKTDVTQPAESERLVERALRSFGRIDMLVNNAGYTLRKTALDTTLAEWDAIMNVHVRAAFCLSTLVAPCMIRQGRGRIINISSQQASCAPPERAAYSSAKKCLEQFTRVLATELAPHKITVNSISPGRMLTRLNPEIRADDKPANVPIGRYGTPDDLRGAVVFLASDASEYVTGVNILVDGGWALIN